MRIWYTIITEGNDNGIQRDSEAPFRMELAWSFRCISGGDRMFELLGSAIGIIVDVVIKLVNDD